MSASPSTKRLNSCVLAFLDGGVTTFLPPCNNPASPLFLLEEKIPFDGVSPPIIVTIKLVHEMLSYIPQNLTFVRITFKGVFRGVNRPWTPAGCQILL